ncbi:MAG: DegT/DnrJ/EryC1/StrS family aminotransferase [Candidatus Omnitrophica bacterium]|nr:DegT/DnrJ/EryC1/StrS family aminotransferase [Candidatus Omnitrophota bacterium]
MIKTSFSIPRVSEQARQYVNAVLDFGFHNGSSPGISARLEREFAAKFGRKFGILHANGTGTMQSALMAAGVGVGDEVIVPAYTVFMTASVALYVNAVPIFADVDPETWTISVEDVRRKITPRTKAIIPVSICGLSPDLDPIMELAREHDLVVIEDNAQCFLGYYKGRVVGSIGQFASFSFQGSKHMTCGDGGILICDNEELATRARKAAVLGFSTLSGKPGDTVVPQELRCHPTFQRHTDLGYNYRLPEIAAAVALGEFERLEELVQMRQAAAACLAEALLDCDWIVPQKTPEGYVHSYFTYAVRMLRKDVDWAEFRRQFVKLGGDGFYGAYLPVYREPVFPKLSDQVKKYPKRYPHYAGILPDYREVSCPVWDSIQPYVMQLKTNSFDLEVAEQQAEILAKTISLFS